MISMKSRAENLLRRANRRTKTPSPFLSFDGDLLCGLAVCVVNAVVLTVNKKDRRAIKK